MDNGGLNLNRSLCAVSGQVGKAIARGIDSVAKAAGADMKQTAQARLAVGQFCAFVLAHVGAPEAAISIVSSVSATSADIAEQEAKRAAAEVEVEAEAVEVEAHV